VTGSAWKALLALLLAIAASELLVVAVAPERLPWPRGVLDDRFNSKIFRPRIVTVPDRPWQYIIGPSGAGTDILSESMDAPTRLVSMPSAPPLDVASTVEWTLRRLLPADRPRRVIWALNVASFRPGVGEDPDEAAACTSDRFVERGTAALWAVSGCPRPLSLGAIDPAYRASNLSHLSLAALFVLEPPEPMVHPYSAKHLASKREIDKVLGYVAPGADRVGRVDRPAVEYTAALCDELGVELIFVILPDRTEMRALLDQGTRAGVLDVLRDQTVIDHYTLAPDTSFFDASHMHVEGARLYTEQLNTALGPIE
jgi:hypothetical protein